MNTNIVRRGPQKPGQSGAGPVKTGAYIQAARTIGAYMAACDAARAAGRAAARRAALLADARAGYYGPEARALAHDADYTGERA